MKAIKHPKTVGEIYPNIVSLADILELGTNPKYEYEGQRHHGKNNRRKTHTKGELKGDSQNFSAVWVKQLKRLLFIDGYHRVDSLRKGPDVARFAPGATILVLTHCVETMADVHVLYEQFNSLQAAKRSGCYFDSGLRQSKELNNIVSAQIIRGPKATAVQLAAGMKGAAKTKAAVMKVIGGIKFVNSLDLPRAGHEIGGVLGAFFAIAQYCGDTRLVSTFIRSINANVCEFEAPTPAEDVLMTYHRQLKNMSGSSKTGGTINDAMFSTGLAAFARFAFLSRRVKGVPVPLDITLSQFIDTMEAKFPLKSV